jgi:FlaA1/EpsC-like NDP-sugar epimerase
VATAHQKILVIKNDACDLTRLEKQIDELMTTCQHKASAEIRRQLKAIIPEYTPSQTASTAN